jgi:hypothetical protein
MLSVGDLDRHRTRKTYELVAARVCTTVTLICGMPRVIVPLCWSAKLPPAAMQDFSNTLVLQDRSSTAQRPQRPQR